MLRCLVLRACAVAVVCVPLNLLAEESVGWRMDGSGSYPMADPPLNWSKEANVAWKTPLPGASHAAPVIAGDRIFVTSEPGELIAVRKEDGSMLWQASHTYADALGSEKAARIEKDHQQAEEVEQQRKILSRERNDLRKAGAADERLKALDERFNELREREKQLLAYPRIRRGASGNTAASPVAAGERVFAVFGTGIVACHNVAGERQWIVHLEPPTNGFGHSASPVLADGTLIVHYDRLFALSADDGRTLWTADVGSRWGTSLATDVGGTPVIVTPNGAVVRVRDGHIMATKLFDIGHSSPLIRDGVIYAMQGGRTIALRLRSASKDAVEADVLWEAPSARERRFASPLVHGGLLYGITEKGILEVLDARDGSLVHRSRTGLSGRAYPSPTAAGDRIFLGGDRGETLILAAGGKFDKLALNELEGYSGAPVFENGRMYLRGREHLYCIEEAGK